MRTEKSSSGNAGNDAASRRDFLKSTVCAGTVCAASSLGVSGVLAAASGEPPADEGGREKKSASSKVGSLDGLDPKNIVDAYRSRQLERLSDREIIQAVASIVSRPCEGLTSFTLHAPLELLARTGLLPLVAPEDRDLARMQIVASAAAYEAGVRFIAEPPSIRPFHDFAAAKHQLADVFQSGDADGLEAVVLQMARQWGVSSLVHSLTPVLLPSLTSASHAHIGLWLLLRHGAAGDPRDASLLRAAARHLAADPKGRLSSFSGMDVRGREPLRKSPARIEKEILEKLANPPHGKRPRGGIRPLMEAAERTGNVDRYFGDFIRHQLTSEQIDAAFRAVLRVSAHAMLQDDPSRAKFGWSHCFTLPQAACGLSSLNIDRKLGLATTMVWIMAYRTILSSRALDFDYRPEPVTASLKEALHTSPQTAAGRFWHADPSEINEARRLLASEASVRNDQHLAKYTRACFDMCGFDPPSWRLYLSSTAKLAAIWIAESPREKIPDRFLNGRSTPD